jgi:hypothetical protein
MSRSLVSIEAIHEAGGIGADDLHLLDCLAVVIGHLQRGMAQQRLQRERIAVAHEVQAGERVPQQMRMEALNPRLSTDTFDNMAQRLGPEATIAAM